MQSIAEDLLVARRWAAVRELAYRWEPANFRSVGPAAMKTLAMFCAGLLATAIAAQKTPAISLAKLNRYADGSCGAILVDAKGRTPFHLGLTKHRCDLFVGATHEDDEAAKLLAPGSDEEKAFLQRLVAWAEQSFGAEERAKIEVAVDVNHRGSGWTFDRYKEAAVVNRLAHYRQIRGALITNVFQGRSTVVLSFKVKDGLGNQQLVLFRKLENGLVRPHLADSTTPVAEESLEERWILQAMLSYTQKNVTRFVRDMLWIGVEVEAEGVTVAAFPRSMETISPPNAPASGRDRMKVEDKRFMIMDQRQSISPFPAWRSTRTRAFSNSRSNTQPSGSGRTMAPIGGPSGFRNSG